VGDVLQGNTRSVRADVELDAWTETDEEDITLRSRTRAGVRVTLQSKMRTRPKFMPIAHRAPPDRCNVRNQWTSVGLTCGKTGKRQNTRQSEFTQVHKM
jgi:hypothetical protein